MSKIAEYIADAVGYDNDGLPASTTQFTFGMMPFQVAESESLDEVTEISAVCQTDAVVDLKVIDNTVMVSFDFSLETNVLVDFVNELETYKIQKQHVTDSLNTLMDEFEIAQQHESEKELEDVYLKMRTMSIPFMLPTILPVAYGGTVHIGFTDDPKFIFFSSDQLNQNPYKIVMIFESSDLFCEDEEGVYMNDVEAEIRAQQEELWYLQEAKRIEEENYQAQFGSNSDYYTGDAVDVQDKRLKGVRIK